MHRTATHHVYAYVLREGQFQRYSDDGEPQGNCRNPGSECAAEKRRDRYCDLLWCGISAVCFSAQAALCARIRQVRQRRFGGLGIVAMTSCTEFTLSCSYNQYGRVSALVPECGGVIEHTDFAGDVTLRCYLRPEAFPHFQRTLADATNGQVSPVVFGEKFVAFPVEAENN